MGLAGWLQRISIGPATRHANSEFTPTAVLLGLLIGCLLCFTNLYFGLQTGWISMMSLQSALIGYLISKLLPTPLSPQEVIVVQTTAVATGTMPLAAGFVGILPALGLISEERDGSPPIHLTWLSAVGWSCSVAFFGVFLSPPIRKQVIIEEQLAFPSGTATAQLISVLHRLPPPDTTIRQRRGYTQVDTEEHQSEEVSEEQEPMLTPDLSTTAHDQNERELIQHEGWHALTYSFVASSIMTLSAYFFPIIFAIPLFGNYLAREWLWTFTPSLSYVGQGIIMGFPTTLSMNLGMLVGWGILSPLSKYQGWAPGPVGDMATGARGWILWTSLAIMCADSVVSLLPVIYEYVSDIIKHSTGKGHIEDKEDHEVETPDRLVPMKWVASGLAISIVVGTVLVWVVFGNEGIKPWATVLGFLFGGMLSILGVRALGETDLNPVSGLGKISQLLFAWIQPGNIVANIIAGGVAEAGAQQAGDLMQDLKTGHLCHASPRAQFLGQLVGSSVSIIVTATAYSLYTKAYPIPGPSFPAPTAYVWLSLARLLRDGQLPDQSAIFMISSALLFGLMSALKTQASRRQLWSFFKYGSGSTIPCVFPAMHSHIDKSFADTKDIIEPDIQPTKSQVGDVESTLQPDDDDSTSFITTKLELWSFYLYYVGNNGLSGFNFGPSQFQNLLFLAGYDPANPPFTTPCSANGCVLPYLGRVRDVNSIVLLTNGISFAIQAVVLLSIGAWADYGRWRPNITIFFTLIAVGVSFAWLGVDDPSKWRAGIALYILGLITYQCALTFWTAAFPGLARDLREVRASATQAKNKEISTTEHADFESLARNRISNVSFAICSLGEIVILAIMVGILKGLKSDESVENNTKAFSVLIAFSGGVWLLCAIPWFLFEKRRPGLALPPGTSLLTIGLKQTYVAFRECLRLKQTFLYLIFYFLMGDVLNTTVTVIATLQNSVVAYSTLQLTLLLIVGIVAEGLGIYLFWLVQKKFAISTKAMLSFNVVWILLLTIWGLIGIHTDKFGFKHVWEIWLYQAYYGLMVCPWYAYSQTMISEVSPLQQMFLFFALFSVVGKTSAFIGPFISSAIITAADNNDNMPFAFLFGLGMFSTIFLWMVDVPKSRVECQEFVRAEADRKAFD
ncbi:hypothetical protein EYR40_007758 [Pleurotus pulmonarius]|nr:hypothetical protein EYR40_007758 [Pleurotus pulmonarius]